MFKHLSFKKAEIVVSDVDRSSKQSNDIIPVEEKEPAETIKQLRMRGTQDRSIDGVAVEKIDLSNKRVSKSVNKSVHL